MPKIQKKTKSSNVLKFSFTETLNSTPGLRSHIPCTLVGTSRAFQECEQNREKSRYTVKRVPLTKNRLRGPFVARKKRSSEAILTKGGDFSTL